MMLRPLNFVSNPSGIPANQDQISAVATQRSSQRYKGLLLAHTASDQNQTGIILERSSQPLQRRQRGTHIGTLGIVVITYARHIGDPLAAVRKTGKLL